MHQDDLRSLLTDFAAERLALLLILASVVPYVVWVPEAGHNGGTWLGYWGKDVQAVPLRRHDQHHMNPKFFVRINGKELEAMIDTVSGNIPVRAEAHHT